MSDLIQCELNKNELVVKGNSLIEACFDLTLVEYRILNLAFTEVFQQKNKKEFEVSAMSYARVYGVSENVVYKQLDDALKKLFNRKFAYKIKITKDGIQDYEYTEARWISNAKYAEKAGYIKFKITDDVLMMVGFLKECFSQYRISQIASLNSVYAIRFYEMMAKWKSVGKTPVISIVELKNILGISPEMYERTIDFKRRVVEPSINQINKHTDIYEAEAIYTKKSRSIVGVYFLFKFKREAIEGESKEVKALTEKQRAMFSNKLSRLASFDSAFPSNVGEDYEDYAERIAEKLLDPENVKAWHEYLVEVGYGIKS